MLPPIKSKDLQLYLNCTQSELIYLYNRKRIFVPSFLTCLKFNYDG